MLTIMKFVSVVGARPQFVKLSAICSEVEPDDQHLILHTGQHYDHEMSGGFFESLNMPQPDCNLAVGSGTHGAQTASMLSGIEEFLAKANPHWVLVFGDTNSTLAAAIAAAKLQIPIAHLEAGLRSWNRRMPEEVNRVLTDHAANLCLAPTPQAMDNLAREGLGSISVMVGDVNVEVIQKTRDLVLSQPPSMPWDVSSEYWLATLHRQELTSDPDRLAEILVVLNNAPVPVYLLAHPVLKPILQKIDLREREVGSLRVADPLAFPQLVWAMLNARGIVTDSGGLQKEAYLLRVPCMTLRPETEWTETLDMGWNRLTWDNPEDILSSSWLETPADYDPNLFGDGLAAKRSLHFMRTK